VLSVRYDGGHEIERKSRSTFFSTPDGMPEHWPASRSNLQPRGSSTSSFLSRTGVSIPSRGSELRAVRLDSKCRSLERRQLAERATKVHKTNNLLFKWPCTVSLSDLECLRCTVGWRRHYVARQGCHGSWVFVCWFFFVLVFVFFFFGWFLFFLFFFFCCFFCGLRGFFFCFFFFFLLGLCFTHSPIYHCLLPFFLSFV